MGAGYISENATPGNVPHPDPNNVASMEGLIPDFPGDTKVLYGGGNDDDDSGAITYVSLRYGGKVISLNNELNGLSMGGIGRDTDVHHIDIMNNVDDGIETWGGTVNYKYVNIWNIGDDCFDVDQGWRGKAQFGLLVQGYSIDAPRGSGVGDNCFEVDGAEDSDWQPVTTAVVYNFTAIGQPLSARGGTTWRDNARVQYRNCIFMDLGLQLVRFDNTDGDGNHGYGFNGTLSWPDTWTTAWNNVPPTPNDPPNRGDFYKSQIDGNLAEIRDSVFFRNLNSDAYTEATARGVFDPSMNNVLIPGFDDADSPVQSLVRGGPVTKGGLTLLPVTFLDPRPKNPAAITSVGTAPEDGVLIAAKYRGAFAPDMNWLCGWTACQAFGFTPTDCAWTDEHFARKGTNGDPLLAGVGTLMPSSPVTLKLSSARPSTVTNLVIGFSAGFLPFLGGTLVPTPNLFVLGLPVNASGALNLAGTWPPGVPSGFNVYFQHVVVDPLGAPLTGLAFSNGLQGRTP
jgi:hypothetical protein